MRFRELKKFREQIFSGFAAGLYIPVYLPQKKGFKIIFYDPADIKVGEISSDIKYPELISVDFEILDVGCGAFNISLYEKLPFEIGYRYRVDIHPYFSSDPWYSGFIMEIPEKTQAKRSYNYAGFGYYEQLDWVLVKKSYTSMLLSDIVKDIISTVIAPKTHIRYNPLKIETVNYTVTSIDFDYIYAKDALETLKGIAQTFDFGVDNFREFYFRSIDTSIREHFWATKHFIDFKLDEDIVKIKNRLYIKQGKILGDSNIIGSVEDSSSISVYGVREDIIVAPEILNPGDALQWAQKILDERKQKKEKGEIRQLFLDDFMKPIEPRGKVKITDKDGNEYILPIKAVKYSISEKGIQAFISLEN